MARDLSRPKTVRRREGRKGAPAPFRFMTETGVVLWTGYIADNLPSLLQGLQQIPGSSIYYHVHHAMFRRPKYTMVDYTNEFARWVWNALGQKGLAEEISSVDPLEWPTIRQLREQLVAFVREHVPAGEVSPRVPLGREFYFLEVRSFILPTGVEASDVEELAEGVEKLGPGGILYHYIEARFRNGQGTNDFSSWLRLRGEEKKAAALERIDTYNYEMEAVKPQILEVLRA